MQVGVGAVPQHRAEAGVSAGGSALRGLAVLPETSDTSLRHTSDFYTIAQTFQTLSRSGTLPYFVCHLLLIAALMAAADEEPDEQQEEEQQQERTYHGPDYHTHLVGRWKRRHFKIKHLQL